MATSTAGDLAAQDVMGFDGANQLLSDAAVYRVERAACLERVLDAAQLLLDMPGADRVNVLEGLRAAGDALGRREDLTLARLWIGLLMARARAQLGYHDAAFRAFYGHLHTTANLAGGFSALDRTLAAGCPREIAEFTIATLEAFGESLPYAALPPATRRSCLELGSQLLRAYCSAPTTTMYRRTSHMAATWLTLLASDDPLHQELTTLSAAAGSAARQPVYISAALDDKVAA